MSCSPARPCQQPAPSCRGRALLQPLLCTAWPRCDGGSEDGQTLRAEQHWTKGGLPLCASRQDGQQEGCLSLGLPFPPKPKWSSPSALPHAPPCQNVPKRALVCSHKASVIKLWDEPEVIKKKKKAFSSTNVNSCILLSQTKLGLKAAPLFRSLTPAEPGFTALRNLYVTSKKKHTKMPSNQIMHQPVDNSDRKAEKQHWVKKYLSACAVIV